MVGWNMTRNQGVVLASAQICFPSSSPIKAQSESPAENFLTSSLNSRSNCKCSFDEIPAFEPRGFTSGLDTMDSSPHVLQSGALYPWNLNVEGKGQECSMPPFTCTALMAMDDTDEQHAPLTCCAIFSEGAVDCTEVVEFPKWTSKELSCSMSSDCDRLSSRSTDSCQSRRSSQNSSCRYEATEISLHPPSGKTGGCQIPQVLPTTYYGKQDTSSSEVKYIKLCQKLGVVEVQINKTMDVLG
eukprot:CAMPEP_0196757066 /NCGR_PEP_ID=MMETSP1091-20130531/103147_1 /TAXON_ID=302021 /ORGANISM="Rhodomonas sp., Strain CCMP768" /LENGTH=241 /DNA_ID=CAMNT_0042105797 /DNA_START=87 /DNA_END=812 /DNA_ORIENTATION=+